MVTDTSERKQHTKTYHRHNNHKLLAVVQWQYYRVDGKIKQSPTGLLCPYCGFIPNQDTINRRLAVLDQVDARYGKSKATK
jgi:hypothetical protein